jgi:hypothetical protein
VIRKLDSIIATRLQGLLLETVNPAVASAIAGYLKLLGYTDINQVQQTVSARKEQITEFAHVWVPLQDRELGEEVPRGISLHYLFLISCAELPMDAAMAKMTKAEVGTSQIRRDSILRIKEALKRVRPPQE